MTADNGRRSQRHIPRSTLKLVSPRALGVGRRFWRTHRRRVSLSFIPYALSINDLRIDAFDASAIVADL